MLFGSLFFPFFHLFYFSLSLVSFPFFFVRSILVVGFCLRVVIPVAVACDHGTRISPGGNNQYGIWIYWMAVRVEI